MDTEKWMPVEGYSNKYEVSNLGRIKSYHKKKPKILLIHYNTNGYPYVNLYYNKAHNFSQKKEIQNKCESIVDMLQNRKVNNCQSSYLMGEF